MLSGCQSSSPGMKDSKFLPYFQMDVIYCISSTLPAEVRVTPSAPQAAVCNVSLPEEGIERRRSKASENLPVIAFLISRRKEEVALRQGKDKNDSVSQVKRRVCRMVGYGQVYHPEDNTGLESILDVTRISNYIQTCIKECNMQLTTQTWRGVKNSTGKGWPAAILAQIKTRGKRILLVEGGTPV